MNADCKKQAFTLVELMVAMVAAAIVVLTVAAMLVLAIRVWNTNNAYVSLRRDAAFATGQMAREIRTNNNVTASVTDKLTVTSVGRKAEFVRTAASNVTYTVNGTVIDPFLARNVAAFTKTVTTATNGVQNGVKVELVMKDSKSRITFTNSTFVYMRN